MKTDLNSDNLEKRRTQLRDAQKRRREKLASGNRHQLNIFLPEAVIRLLDAECEKRGIDRHYMIERLLLELGESGVESGS